MVEAILPSIILKIFSSRLFKALGSTGSRLVRLLQFPHEKICSLLAKETKKANTVTKSERFTDIIEAFNSTSIYLDDLLNIDNPYFEQMVGQIYPHELVK